MLKNFFIVTVYTFLSFSLLQSSQQRLILTDRDRQALEILRHNYITAVQGLHEETQYIQRIVTAAVCLAPPVLLPLCAIMGDFPCIEIANKMEQEQAEHPAEIELINVKIYLAQNFTSQQIEQYCQENQNKSARFRNFLQSAFKINNQRTHQTPARQKMD